MKFTEARKLREDNPNLEHELRAAKVTAWMLDNNKISKSETQDLYEGLIDSMYNSEEEYDQIVYYILDEIRTANKEEKKKKGGKKK